MDADGLRELLGEAGAFELHRRGVRDMNDRESWSVVAAVLEDLLGDPSDVIEGRATT